MTLAQYSDEDIARLRSIEKEITNPRAKWIEKPKEYKLYRQQTFQAKSNQVIEVDFTVYQRQSLNDKNDFSCGIIYLPPSGEQLTLARYNGPSHIHGDIVYLPHIHQATQRAISEGRKPEYYAEPTDRYNTLLDAFVCLIQDYNLTGYSIVPQPHPVENLTQTSLFS